MVKRKKVKKKVIKAKKIVRKAKAKKKILKNEPSFIKIGILGREAQTFTATHEMKCSDLVSQLDVEPREIKASINGTDGFKVISGDDVVNGYKAILVIPAVSGGRR